MAEISEHRGNIFTTSCDTLAVTVNCVGDMGAGIALEAKYRYPAMAERYRELCLAGQLEPGKLWLWSESAPRILCFPTKKPDALDRIIHTPFIVESDHNSMVQLADLVAYIIRRWVELQRADEGYPGERSHVNGWFEALAKLTLPKADRHPSRGATDAASMFNALAAPEIVAAR